MTQNESEIILEENESNCNIICNNIDLDSVIDFLIEEEYEFDFDEKSDTIIVEANIEELSISLLERDMGVYTPTLVEGIAKKKYVVRAGKRKIIFKCKPGEKRVGRSCRRIPSGLLNKMKRRAKRGARKARSKRMRANRRRKVSVRRRMKRAGTVKQKPISKPPKPTRSKIKSPPKPTSSKRKHN